jgi:hypothetical protein
MILFLSRLGGLVGLSGRLAAMAGAVLILLTAGAGLYGLKSCYDSRLVETHDAKRDAATDRADRKADARAADRRRTDDARLVTEAHELEGATANATSDLDRRRARHACLRLQQSARAENRQPPSCD